MKFTKQHLAVLKSGLDKVFTARPMVQAEYEAGEFPNSDKVKDLQTRFCFDMLYCSRVKIGDGVGIHGDINGDYTSDHILTALKSLCPTVTRNY